MKEVITKSEKETMDAARAFGERTAPGTIVCLEGDLGAGKTHFVKGFAQAFGIHPEQVTSPTFTIINEYRGTLPVFHFDFYRITDYSEALEIGAEEYFYGNGVCIIEWPGRIEEILPDTIQTISITSTGKSTRKIIFQDE